MSQEQDSNALASGDSTPSKNYNPYLSMKELSGAISVLGLKKANTRSWQLFLLGILAGLYISLGGLLFLVALNEGMGKIVGGGAFSIGLILVVIAGAELFTGNVIMIVGTITMKVRVRDLLRNWLVVYIANFVGAILTAYLIWQSGLFGKIDVLNNLGVLASQVADAKLALTFKECFVRGIFCNMLVIISIIMATMAKDYISKSICIVFPIMTFVACGFEHSIANMFLIPIGMIAKGTSITDMTIMFKNIIPVTLGNIIGGISILLIHPNRIRQVKHLLDIKVWNKNMS